MSTLQARFERLQADAPALARTTAAQRADKLRRLLDATLAAKDDIVDACARELNSSYISTAFQLLLVKAEIEYLITHLAAWMQPEPVADCPQLLGRRAYVHHEPKGLVLNLNTWNAPFACGLNPCAGALAAGNAVVLKPSELAPHSSKVLRRIVEAAFGPDEFLVEEGGAEVAQELLTLPFNHIYYTGGHRVGRLVMRAAAEHFAGVTLEMGGKNPVIVDAGADINDAASKIATGRLANAGQICIAPDYVLVHRSQQQRLLDALGGVIAERYDSGGAGAQHNPDFQRIISDAHFDRIRGLIDDAVANGATVVLGGDLDAADRYIGPTVLTDVTERMKIMQEEIFGPVLPVIPFDTPTEAVAMVARRPKPLALYIYATDRAQVDYYLQHTSAGSSAVNNNVIQAGIPTLPFGGIGHSGMGRVNGRQSFREFSNARAVVEDALQPQPQPALSAQQLRALVDHLLCS